MGHIPSPAPKPGEFISTSDHILAENGHPRVVGAIVTPDGGLQEFTTADDQIEMLNAVSKNMVPLDYGDKTHDGAIHVNGDDLIAGGF